jgi:hypothetical protein
VNIQPGKPAQNARVGRLPRKQREECLWGSWFQNWFDTRRKIACLFQDYNEPRPHSSLNCRTPAEFAREMSYGNTLARRETRQAFPIFPQLRLADGPSVADRIAAAVGGQVTRSPCGKWGQVINLAYAAHSVVITLG